eukprot:192219_1
MILLVRCETNVGDSISSHSSWSREIFGSLWRLLRDSAPRMIKTLDENTFPTSLPLLLMVLTKVLKLSIQFKYDDDFNVDNMIVQLSALWSPGHTTSVKTLSLKLALILMEGTSDRSVFTTPVLHKLIKHPDLFLDQHRISKSDKSEEITATSSVPHDKSATSSESHDKLETSSESHDKSVISVEVSTDHEENPFVAHTVGCRRAAFLLLARVFLQTLKTGSSSKTILSDQFASDLEVFIHRSGLDVNDTQFRKCLFDIFQDEDDQLVKILSILLEITSKWTSLALSSPQKAPQIINSLVKYFEPSQLFLCFLKATGEDPSLLLDLLISNETDFLSYLMLYLKLTRHSWPTEHFQSAPSDLDSIMSVLIRLRISLEKLVAKDIFPFNIKPLVKLICDIE